MNQAAAKGLLPEDTCLVLLSDECGCVILPTGQYIAAENKSGQLERWLQQWMADRDKRA